MNDQFNYKLWKRDTNSPARFIRTDDIPKIGFTSIYSVRELEAQQLETYGYSGFRGIVYDPYLWVDCDNNDYCSTIESILQEERIGYTIYTTGNRGRHYRIDRRHEPTQLLPTWDKQWVSHNLPGADTSLYSHMHLLRVEGATHEKTGKKKELIGMVPGRSLMFPRDLPIIDEKGIKEYQKILTGRLECVFEDAIIMSKTVPSQFGDRHKVFCSVASRLCDLGQPVMFTEGWLANLNLMADPPLEAKDIERIIEWAYTKRT